MGLSAALILLGFLASVCMLGALAEESSTRSEQVMEKVIAEFPELLEIDVEDIVKFLDTKTGGWNGRGSVGAELTTHFVGMPEGSGQQRGACNKLLSEYEKMNWIQGRSDLTAGSMTLVYYMSQSCISCHDVAIKLNKMYKEWRHRGLNILAIHSSPKGYSSSDDDILSLREFIKKEKIEFAIVDMPSKAGKQPTLSSGLPDWKKAGKFRFRFIEGGYIMVMSFFMRSAT